ncbi:MAG TPA: aldehyde ferredoxin oxidoreductase C-terminal domain-containing protein [Anaerolineales bacterium]|nr:aldehyde ferredoxin oxidoreductase C-terminal domain-containing protein [Anaerolineales bacterium]
MSPFGYHGKVLHIDLSAQNSWVEQPGDNFWRIYGGGGLLAAYYLLQGCPPGCDPFGPENLLILTSSVAAGHPYAGLARFTAAAKSPLTGGIGEARAEGPFGQAVKGSGVDCLVFHGKAERPLSVVVEEGQASFYDATDLWGLRVNQSVDVLDDQFGKDIHTAVIGPAGERLVRFASLVSDRTYQAARTGMGAVMGSKQLKAVVLRGDNLPPVADPEACARLTEMYRTRMHANALTRWQLEPPGFSAWVHLHGLDAALCTHNYREAIFEAADAYEASLFLPYYRGDGDCPGCPNNCIKFFSAGEEAILDPRAGGIHQEVTGTLGPNLGTTGLATIFRANILCNDLGLDPTSLGFTLSMAMECAELGLLSQEQTGRSLRFGDEDNLLEWIQAVAYREGFGETLAEGSRRAAEAIGGQAARYALHVKGQEMVCFEPRTQTNLALGYATAPVGPRYEICEHDWDYDTQVGWEHTLESSRTVGILERIPMDYLGERKVRNFKALASLWSAADALDVCIFAIAPTRVFSLQHMAELLAGVTGWNTSAYEIMRFGERRLHLMRVYNLREGLTAADDILPERFFSEPLRMPGMRWDGKRLDREAFLAAIRTYYRMMGWDDDGRPRYETLLDHHLEWVVEYGHAERI